MQFSYIEIPCQDRGGRKKKKGYYSDAESLKGEACHGWRRHCQERTGWGWHCRGYGSDRSPASQRGTAGGAWGPQTGPWGGLAAGTPACVGTSVSGLSWPSFPADFVKCQDLPSNHFRTCQQGAEARGRLWLATAYFKLNQPPERCCVTSFVG